MNDELMSMPSVGHEHRIPIEIFLYKINTENEFLFIMD